MANFIRSENRTRREQILGPNGEVFRDATYSNTVTTLQYSKPVASSSPVIMLGKTPWRNQTSWYRTSMDASYISGLASFTDGWATWKVEGVHSELSPAFFPEHSPGGTWGFSAQWDPNTRRRVEVEAMLKLQNGRVNLGNALAESKTTLGHIASTATDVLLAYRAARRGDVKSVAKHLGVKPGGRARPDKAWLEYQYAWKPLLGDIYDAYNSLQKAFDQKGQILHVVRVVTDTAKPTRANVSGSSTRKHRCHIWCRVDQAGLHAATQLGLTNPLAIAWELMPYSFVVDWMLPIGNVLSACTAPMGLTFLSGSVSVSVNGYHTEERPFNVFGGLPVKGVNPQVVTHVASYDRVALGGFPLPRLYYKSPFTTEKMMSASALISGLLSKR